MAPRGGGAKFGDALPKLRILCPKTAFLGPKRPENSVKTGKRRETVATFHVRLDFTMSKSPPVPFNSTICPRNGPKRRQKATKSALCAPTPPKPSTGCILGYVAQNPIPSAPSPPATPDFLWFPGLRIAQRDAYTGVHMSIDPRTSGHLVEPEGSPARAQRGPTVGPPGPPGQKIHFFQSCS